MRINGKHHRTIWVEQGDVCVIDQRLLPFEMAVEKVSDARHMATVIQDMYVRGAPLIGASAAFGVYLASREVAAQYHEFSNQSEEKFHLLVEGLAKSRPTAVNLHWALKRQQKHFDTIQAGSRSWEDLTRVLIEDAQRIVEEDVQICRSIGEHGVTLIEEIAARKNGETVHILTHCNAGWIATIDYGTATAPIYIAKERGLDVHVWVDETRPRLQGSKLTAFEFAHEEVPHTVITDNTGGHLMQRGDVDLCIVGTDRTTCAGDVANKIGTYLKALAAKDNDVPFYVALPSTTVDWEIEKGEDIPIEVRDEREITQIEGKLVGENRVGAIEIAPKGSSALNYAFDITPARLVTGLITEKGIVDANKAAIKSLLFG